jgi:glycosyltransferase involved in cell wall biosynthesis
MKTLNLHIYPSYSQYDTRILNETKSLARHGIFDRIAIVGLWKEGLKEHEKIDDAREIWRVVLKTDAFPEGTFSKIIKHIEWALKIFRKFKGEPVSCINCHNLSTLTIGVLFSLFDGAKVVYDAHELETERTEWSMVRKAMAKLLERCLIRRADLVIVVSESIAQWYRERYSLSNVYTIHNFPDLHLSEDDSYKEILKRKFKIRSEEILFIYQGLIDSGRSVDLLLETFSGIDRRRHIVFMGYGALEEKVKQYEKDYSNIHFQPAVSPDEYLNYTQSADVGFSLIENTSLSYYLTLATKFCEYLVAGIPVITTDFPEPGKIIDLYDCGWKVPYDITLITDLIECITKQDIRTKAYNASECRDNFMWSREEEKMINTYKETQIVGKVT